MKNTNPLIVWKKLSLHILKSKWNLVLLAVLILCVVLDWTHESEIQGCVSIVVFILIAQLFRIATFQLTITANDLWKFFSK